MIGVWGALNKNELELMNIAIPVSANKAALLARGVSSPPPGPRDRKGEGEEQRGKRERGKERRGTREGSKEGRREGGWEGVKG